LCDCARVCAARFTLFDPIRSTVFVVSLLVPCTVYRGDRK